MLLSICLFTFSAEEQAKGVFPKTLRNMWSLVAFFNPTLAFLAVGVLPLEKIRQSSNDVLAQMGGHAAGDWLRFMVSIDACLVLSGSVLTSYVGVTGLVRRMSLDR